MVGPRGAEALSVHMLSGWPEGSAMRVLRRHAGREEEVSRMGRMVVKWPRSVIKGSRVAVDLSDGSCLGQV